MVNRVREYFPVSRRSVCQIWPFLTPWEPVYSNDQDGVFPIGETLPVPGAPAGRG